MAVSKVKINHIGNQFAMKNQYLLDRAEGKNVANHPYLEALKAFEAKEREFLSQLSSARAGDPYEQYQRRLEQAEKKAAFYQPYVELSYDAELAYKNALVEVEQIPAILETYAQIEQDLKAVKQERSGLDPSADQQARVRMDAELKALEQDIDQQRERIRELYKQKRISSKALQNNMVKFKRQLKIARENAERAIPSKALELKEKNLLYRLKQDPKKMEAFIQAEKNDLQQNIPIEIAQKTPWKSFLSFPIPGLGQILNGQYIKGLLMLLLAVFNYVIAIPYALGYGNYQGRGIAGLVNLAIGGKRLDKSLFFMIEGVIAIFLVIIAIFIFWISFRDAYKVEKDKILGKRPNTWNITSKKILEEGFPYTVTLPSAIMIIFIVLVPIVTSLLLSLAGQDPQNQSKFGWVGFENYLALIKGSGLAGALFWRILLWTIIWTLGATTLSILVGFFLAILLNNERVRLKPLFRTVYILPWAIPGFISILLFSIMFSPDSYLTNVLNAVTGQQILVKDSTFWTRTVLIVMKTWLGSSYIFLLSLGVLQSIPGDLYEAADIDGATSWQKLTKITLPLVLFQTAPLLVGQYTFNFNDFTAIFLFNGGGPFNTSLYGNLAGSSDILISYIFKLTMNNNYQSIGAAIAIIISFGLMAFAYIGFSRSKAFREIK